MSSLYQTIATLCQQKELSIAALCRKANVSPGIISDLKNGRKKTINVETASKLATALSVSADTLTGAPTQEGDALIAFYGEVKDLLDETDKNDLIAFMRMKAELKQYDQNRDDGTNPR
ncbi:MAG: helix-turn-helix transcriptional regulator [Faecalibacterium sp.]